MPPAEAESKNEMDAPAKVFPTAARAARASVFTALESPAPQSGMRRLQQLAMRRVETSNSAAADAAAAPPHPGAPLGLAARQPSPPARGPGGGDRVSPKASRGRLGPVAAPRSDGAAGEEKASSEDKSEAGPVPQFARSGPRPSVVDARRKAVTSMDGLASSSGSGVRSLRSIKGGRASPPPLSAQAPLTPQQATGGRRPEASTSTSPSAQHKEGDRVEVNTGDDGTQQGVVRVVRDDGALGVELDGGGGAVGYYQAEHVRRLRAPRRRLPGTIATGSSPNVSPNVSPSHAALERRGSPQPQHFPSPTGSSGGGGERDFGTPTSSSGSGSAQRQPRPNAGRLSDSPLVGIRGVSGGRDSPGSSDGDSPPGGRKQTSPSALGPLASLRL